MARKNRNEIAVGITTLVVLVLTIYILVMLSDWSSLFAKQQEITVRLPYKVGLKGLGEGSPVHLGGIKIGQITQTKISKLGPTNPGIDEIYVFFTMKIPKQYKLRRDCVLMAQSNALGGEALLSIEDLGREDEIINDGQTVDLMLADSVIDVIKREFDSDNPESILALIKYEVNRNNADSIVRSLKDVGAQLEESIPAVKEKIEQTLAKADSALETAKSALKNMKALAGDERINRILSNINEVSVNLKLTSREVRRAPWKLLYKPKQDEFKIQALIDSAGAFASGAERLDSAALCLQKIATTKDMDLPIDKNQVESMVSELETSFEQFQKAEQKFWKELE